MLEVLMYTPSRDQRDQYDARERDELRSDDGVLPQSSDAKPAAWVLAVRAPERCPAVHPPRKGPGQN